MRPVCSWFCAFAFLLLPACGFQEPDISFMDYDEDYRSKPDFARLEHELPLVPGDRLEITPRNLEALSQEQVDQVYARLTAGPVPDGVYDGTFFFADGAGLKRLAELIGGRRGLAARIKIQELEALGQLLWKGKVFDRDRSVLRNMIQDPALLTLLMDEPGALEKTPIPGRKYFGLIQDEAWLLFPAKVFCGQSLLDSRRESIIIDYAFNDDIEGYRKRPDALAGRRGLRIRDEIRMVRPGFYLGRAYMGRVFVANFTLYNEAVADSETEAFVQTGTVHEECWTGTQTRRPRSP